MSWAVTLTGKASAVADAFDKEQYVPQPLKDMVRAMANESSSENGAGGLFVKTNGHHCGGYIGSGVQNFKCVCSKLVLVFALLMSVLVLSGCGTLSPGADPIEVRAEQTEGFFADTADLFLHIEYDNVDFCRTNLPDVHKAAEFLRQPVIVGTNAWPRDIAMVQSFGNTRRAYKANRTTDNRASLTAALAAIEQALHEIEAHLSTLNSQPSVQARSSAQLKAALAPHVASPAPPNPAAFAPLPK